MSLPKSTKILTASASRPESVTERFKIIASMLSGKRDVTNESSHGPIADDTQLSASTVKAFLKKLVDLGYVDATYIQAYRPGNPHMPYTESHSEYVINEQGAQYIRDQLAVWGESDYYSAEIGNNIGEKLSTYVPYRDKDCYPECEDTYIQAVIKNQLAKGLYKYQVGLSLMKAGYSFTQIADIMGISTMTVNSYSFTHSRSENNKVVYREVGNFLQFQNDQEEQRFSEECEKLAGKPRGRKNLSGAV